MIGKVLELRYIYFLLFSREDGWWLVTTSMNDDGWGGCKVKKDWGGGCILGRNFDEAEACYFVDSRRDSHEFRLNGLDLAWHYCATKLRCLSREEGRVDMHTLVYVPLSAR